MNISLFLAFGAGILSFFSPCILPLIPAYISFITGLSMEELKSSENSKVYIKNLRLILWQTTLFILGFSFIFVCLGATASYLGNIISRYEKAIRIFGGIVIILLGMHVAGILNIKQLEYEKKWHLARKPAHIFGSFIVGIVFAVGWTPCVGPILAAILGLAGTQETLIQGIILLVAYSLGLGIPFLITAVAMNAFLNLFSKVKRYFKIVSIASGTLLMIIGILIMTNNLRFFTGG